MDNILPSSSQGLMGLPSGLLQLTLGPLLGMRELCAMESVSKPAHALLALDSEVRERLWHALAEPSLWIVRRRRVDCRTLAAADHGGAAAAAGGAAVALPAPQGRESWKALCRRAEVGGAYLAVVGGSDGVGSRCCTELLRVRRSRLAGGEYEREQQTLQRSAELKRVQQQQEAQEEEQDALEEAVAILQMDADAGRLLPPQLETLLQMAQLLATSQAQQRRREQQAQERQAEQEALLELPWMQDGGWAWEGHGVADNSCGSGSPCLAMRARRDALAVAADGRDMFACGGWCGAASVATDSVEWARLPAEWPRLQASPAAAAAAGGDAGGGGGGAAGGEQPHGRLSSLWIPLPEMSLSRCFAGAACDGAGALWVAGGASSLMQGARVYRHVETLPLCAACLCFRSCEEPGRSRCKCQAQWPAWEARPELALPRAGHVLAYSAREEAMYAVGGYGGGMLYHATVEMLQLRPGGAAGGAPEPAAAAWEVLPAAMCTPRTGAGASFGPDGQLYVAGGSLNGSRMLSSCECYDSRSGMWSRLPDMPTERGYLSAAFAVDGCLYVAGGHETNGFGGPPLSVVERFDVRAQRWEQAPDLELARSDLACAFLL
jgi:hypothetical protein